MEDMIGAKCLACDPHGPGALASRQGKMPHERIGTYFGRLYPVSKWARRPKCVNCKGPMTPLYDVKQ
jgi:hypothetical protein